MRVAVLAAEDNGTALGDRLDTTVEQDGVEIRFTGPWPHIRLRQISGQSNPAKKRRDTRDC